MSTVHALRADDPLVRAQELTIVVYHPPSAADRARDEVGVEVDGVRVWVGSMSQWSNALTGQRAVHPLIQPR